MNHVQQKYIDSDKKKLWKCNSLSMLECCYFKNIFTHWISNVMYGSVTK
jgi:hypothetical protein